MCLHIYIYIYIHINTCICLSVSLSFSLSIYLSLYIYIYIFLYIHIYIYIYIYIHTYIHTHHHNNIILYHTISYYIMLNVAVVLRFGRPRRGGRPPGLPADDGQQGLIGKLRPVHLLRVSLLRVLESNFPGDPLSN